MFDIDGGDFDTLDADSALGEILRCEQIVAAAQARQIRALARFAQLRPDHRGPVISEFTADEIVPCCASPTTPHMPGCTWPYS